LPFSNRRGKKGEAASIRIFTVNNDQSTVTRSLCIQIRSKNSLTCVRYSDKNHSKTGQIWGHFSLILLCYSPVISLLFYLLILAYNIEYKIFKSIYKINRKKYAKYEQKNWAWTRKNSSRLRFKASGLLRHSFSVGALARQSTVISQPAFAMATGGQSSQQSTVTPNILQTLCHRISCIVK
jgi:hypothetical protein